MNKPENLPDLLKDLDGETLAAEIKYLVAMGYIRKEIDGTLSVTEEGQKFINEIDYD